MPKVGKVFRGKESGENEREKKTKSKKVIRTLQKIKLLCSVFSVQMRKIQWDGDEGRVKKKLLKNTKIKLQTSGVKQCLPSN